MSSVTDSATIEREAAETAELNQQADDLEHDLEADSEPGNVPEGHLLDPALYETEELAIPGVDGEGVDKISARFTGRVWLDRSDPADVALIRDLRMGRTVTLSIEARVGPPVPGYTTNRDGDLDSRLLGRTFTVTSVWRTALDPEQNREQKDHRP